MLCYNVPDKNILSYLGLIFFILCICHKCALTPKSLTKIRDLTDITVPLYFLKHKNILHMTELYRALSHLNSMCLEVHIFNKNINDKIKDNVMS